MSIKNFLILVFAGLLMISCGDDDSESTPPNQPDQFQAVITFDTFDISEQIIIQTGTEVTISAANSLGLEGASIEWIASTPYDVNSSGQFFSETDNNPTDSVLTFRAIRSGGYSFTLELIKNGRITQASLFFIVEGALEISSVNDLEDLTFKNLDGATDPAAADYVINSDFIIPDGTSCRFEPGVTIRFGDNAGLIIQGSLAEDIGSSTIWLTGGATNWKGIHLTGRISAGQFYVQNAGSSSFTSNPDDAAAIYVEEGGELNTSATRVLESEGYAINATGEFQFGFGSTAFIQIQNSTKSMKLPGSVLPKVQVDITPTDYEHVEVFHDELIQTYLNMQSSSSIQRLRILDSLVLRGFAADNAEIIMNPASYISVCCEPSGALNSVIRGNSNDIADSWRGIKVENVSFDFSGSQIQGAGVGLLPELNFSTAMYIGQSATLTMNNALITDNRGAGVTSFGIVGDLRDNTFSNNDRYHLGIGCWDADRLAGNTFDNTANAVELISVGGAPSNAETIPSLGTGNFYVSRVNLDYFNDLQILENVHIKMDLNTYISVGRNFDAVGSQSSPIIIEGLQNSNGYWQGLSFIGGGNMSFVDILDGGRLDGATTFNTQFAGGLVIQSPPNRSVSITNCNVTNAGQYGAVIRLGAGDFAIDSTIYNNTFQGTLGDIFDEN